jgi:hypothetical protein
MRTFAAPAVLPALALAGCGGDVPTATAPDAPALARAGAASQARPVKGGCETPFTSSPLAPPVFRVTETGTGHLSHLGGTTVSEVIDLNPEAGTQAGEITFTAASGDVLRGVIAGTNAPIGSDSGSYSDALTFPGRTGRFARATGHASAEGAADLASNTASSTLVGGIAHDLSDQGHP